MSAARRWTVDISIGDVDGNTSAEARLHAGDHACLAGTGHANLNPADRNIPAIGDKLAVARALGDLGQRLLRAAAADIEAASDGPTRVRW